MGIGLKALLSARKQPLAANRLSLCASKEACRHAPEHAWPIVTRQDLDQTFLQFDRFRRFLMHKLHCLLRSLSRSLQLKAAGCPVKVKALYQITAGDFT